MQKIKHTKGALNANITYVLSAAVSCAYRLGGVGLGCGMTGKLGRAWVGAWVGAWLVHGLVHGWCMGTRIY